MTTYQVNFQGNPDVTEDPAIYDGEYTLEQACDLCTELNCRALLWNDDCTVKKGTIDSHGNYTLL